MLKGPSLTSKTYFVPLPETLDQLVTKAVQLFPVPPGKVPHITLGTDERAIILQESYDFIRDRELLHFRWSAETPRRNLANRVRWDAPSATASTTPFSLNPTASPQNTTAEVTLPSSIASAAEALKAQLQGSPSSKRDLASTTRANTIANRDPNTQFGEGASARKAHAQRVLAEQQRKRDEEHTADALGAAPIIPDIEQEAVIDADPEATAKAALELAATSPLSEGVEPSTTETVTEQSIDSDVQKNATVTTTEDVFVVSDTSDEMLTPTEAAASELLMASTPAEVTIQSPPRKKHIDNGGLDTPPSSGSRSSSPFHSSDRALSNVRPRDHRMRAPADDEPSSSPMSSPTRDVSSRHRIIGSAAPICELVLSPSKAQQQEETPATEEASLLEAADSLELPASKDVQDLEIAEEPTHTSAIENSALPPTTESESEAAATKPAADLANDRELNRIYSFLTNLVLLLLSHKANWAFQRPMSVEFERFSSRSSRPVDLFTIRDTLTSRKYGSQHLEGRMAANAVVTEFEDDLSLLYNNARRFFGIRSTQAECVEHLEKFSKSFLNEWKRTQGSAAQSKPSAQASSDAAAARLSAFRSPGSRSEKRPAMLSSSPFAMLLTPGQSSSNGGLPGSSGRKTVGLNGQPLSAALLA